MLPERKNWYKKAPPNYGKPFWYVIGYAIACAMAYPAESSSFPKATRIVLWKSTLAL